MGIVQPNGTGLSDEHVNEADYLKMNETIELRGGDVW